MRTLANGPFPSRVRPEPPLVLSREARGSRRMLRVPRPGKSAATQQQRGLRLARACRRLVRRAGLSLSARSFWISVRCVSLVGLGHGGRSSHLPGRFEFGVAGGEDLLGASLQLVLGRDVADRTVQANGIVVLDIVRHDA